MEHVVDIDGTLYKTDWRYEDLYRFWSLTMDEDIVKGINDGAKMMRASIPAVVPARIEKIVFSKPNPRQTEFQWSF